jgi:DNA-binding transcriptional MerR regulator
MRVKKFLRPIDLAKAIGLSTQTVHNYECWGFIPQVERSEKGYRLYTAQHLRAIQVARVVIIGHGWERARRIMSHVHEGDLASALAIIDEHSAQIHAERCEVEQTLEILRTSSTSLQELTKGSGKQSKGLRVGEVAKLAGVRVSAVRFWEEQGLLQPTRDKESKYRLYDDEQVRRLQIVVLLRKSGYDFVAIRAVLEQLTTGTAGQALTAAQHRLSELLERSGYAFKATATLWQYANELQLNV